MNRLSLVLITVDCLRADHVGFQGYSRPVTPFLDSIARDSLVISDAVVAGAPTYFSFPGILASRPPLGLGREVLGIAPGEATLTTALRGAGFETAAFLAANPYLSSRYGYSEGFEKFADYLDRPLAPQFAASDRLSKLNSIIRDLSRSTRITASAYQELYFWYCQWRSWRENLSLDELRRYPSADVLINDAREWLSSRTNAPFFLWIHLMDPHHPYFPTAAAIDGLGLRISAKRAGLLNSLWNRGDLKPARLQRYREAILSLYDAGIFWVDQQISRLVQALQHLQRWDETIFVLTADHGEEFLEHGNRYHSPTGLPEQLIRVPLLLRAPNVSSKVIPGTFSLIHLAPTLLQALGVTIPAAFRGRGLWQELIKPELPEQAAVVECTDCCNNPMGPEHRIRPRILAVRQQNWKLVVYFETGKDYLFDLERDPGEKNPLPEETKKEKRVHLLRIASEHLKVRPAGNSSLAIRARLRELVSSLDAGRALAKSSSAAD